MCMPWIWDMELHQNNAVVWMMLINLEADNYHGITCRIVPVSIIFLVALFFIMVV